MATCRICASRGQGQVNVLLLNGAPMAVVARACKLPVATIKNHKLNHIPYRPANYPKPATTAEKFADLEYQLARLRCLAEAGEEVGGALKVVYAQKALLELEMRAEGRLDPSNHKKILAAPSADQDFEVVFTNGRPRTVAIEKKAS
jgi:hypothetical protein